MYINSTAQLSRLLSKAAEAHHKWEEEHGKDENWQDWYAEYIAEELAILEIGARTGQIIRGTLQ